MIGIAAAKAQYMTNVLAVISRNACLSLRHLLPEITG